MPTVTWTHGGTPNTANLGTFSGASGSGSSTPDYVAAVATWIATTDENGTMGTVNFTADGGNPFFAIVSILVQVFDAGSIDPLDAVNTIRVAFDYDVTNGPMGTGTAKSSFHTGLGVDVVAGPGASSGTVDQTDTGASQGIATMGDWFAIFGSVGGVAGIGFDCTFYYDTGTFSAHNRALTISNFLVEVNYGAVAPVVTDVTPTHGDKAGGTVVTLTGTDLDTGTSAFFGGTAGSGYVAASSVSATCVAPAHAVGQVTVTVT